MEMAMMIMHTYYAPICSMVIKIMIIFDICWLWLWPRRQKGDNVQIVLYLDIHVLLWLDVFLFQKSLFEQKSLSVTIQGSLIFLYLVLVHFLEIPSAWSYCRALYTRHWKFIYKYFYPRASFIRWCFFKKLICHFTRSSLILVHCVKDISFVG